MQTKSKTESNLRVIGNYNQILNICKTKNVDRIIVALDERRGKFPLQQLLYCRLKGIRIEEGISFTEQLVGKLSIENLRPSSIIFSDGFKRSAFYKNWKRWMDVVGSLLGFVLLAPVGFIVSIAIKLDSKGPLLYRQERVGEDGKTFQLLKFRSMCVDAEENGPMWAKVNDLRITKIGHFIRRARLDEIPQLINVLKGEMSFIGPRPERPFFVNRLSKEIPFYSERHVIKPGVTGWAQINYHYGASKKDSLEKLKYDFFYIKHMSLYFDLIIFFETIKIVLLGRGAR